MTRPTPHEWPNDEVLVAYADGTLDADAAAAVAKYLETDAEARAFVRALQDSADLAKHAFEDAMNAPASSKLIGTIMNGTTAQLTPQPRTANVLPMQQRPTWAPSYAVPLAACIALLIGGLGGFQLASSTKQMSSRSDVVAVGLVQHGSNVLRALETSASNNPVALGSPGTDSYELMIVATFRDAKGRICRELEVTEAGAAGGITAAVACRQPDGNWLVEGAVRMAASPPAPDHDFTPAKGTTSSAIEGVLSAIGAKRALAPADEQQLLENGWK